MDEYTYEDNTFNKPRYSAEQMDAAVIVGAVFGFLGGFSIAMYSFSLV